jgi:HflK protein
MLVIEFIKNLFYETYIVFLESSIYIVFGFFIAGLINTFIKQEWILRFMTGKGIKPIIYASLFGIPLPLCSCGVIPAAVMLEKKGAQKNAIMSFLISTPETDIDAIILTYGLLGPFFAIFRTIAAFLTSIIAGIAYTSDDEEKSAEVTTTCNNKCCGSLKLESDQTSENESIDKSKRSFWKYAKDKARITYNYGFIEIFDDVSVWILVGILITGFISAVIPDKFFETYLGSGFISMIVMILIGVPMYMCASSSTPIAAALIAKGLNPGAAFVFLLVGPATNAATITVLLKQFGKRFVKVYVSSLIIVSITFGLLFNYMINTFGFIITSALKTGSSPESSGLKFVGFVLMVILLFTSFKRIGFVRLKTKLMQQLFKSYESFKDINWYLWYKNQVTLSIIFIVLFFYLSTAIFIIEPGEIGITKLFGRVTAKDLGPGLHFNYPYPFGSHVICKKDFIRKIEVGFSSAVRFEIVDKKLGNYIFGDKNKKSDFVKQVRDEKESFHLTGDENIIDLTFSVQYKVLDPYKFTFGIENPDELVKFASKFAVLDSIAERNIDEIYSTMRSSIEQKAFHKLDKLIKDYDLGIEILGIYLLSVHAPEEVHFAFRDVAGASEDKNTLKNKSYADYEETVNLADGSAKKMVFDASGYRASKLCRARGDAQNFIIQENAYENSREITRFRLYNEAIQKVLPKSKLYIKPSSSREGDIDLYIMNEKTNQLLNLTPEKDDQLETVEQKMEKK